MSESNPHDQVRQIISRLGSRSLGERNAARRDLVEIGRPAVADITRALSSSNSTVRLEAAKILGDIGDPSSAAPLVKLMSEDQQLAVRLAASHSISMLGRAGGVALLRALASESVDDVWLREGAHYILRSSMGDEEESTIGDVVRALESPQAAMTVPIVAYKALSAMGEYISTPAPRETPS